MQDCLQRLNNPEFHNWLAVGEALMLLSHGLRKYAEQEMKVLQAHLITKVGSGGCSCSSMATPSAAPIPHGNKASTCKWAFELKKLHVFKCKNDIPWGQSDCRKWHDPIVGHWEIAKLFMSDLGADMSIRDPGNTDFSPLINVFMFCKHFKVQNATLKVVRKWRNKCAHAANRTLSDQDKIDAFQDMYSLMKDAELQKSKDVQDCDVNIRNVEVADMSMIGLNKALPLLEEFRRVEECNLKRKEIKEKRKNIKKEAALAKKRDQKTNSAVTIAQKIVRGFFVGGLFLLPLCLMDGRSARKPLWSLVMCLLLLHVGDESSSIVDDEGCSSAMIKSPISHFNFHEFQLSSYLVQERKAFVGRRWLFMELESIFDDESVPGVLITGEPGSGKSALMSQLVCSNTSSMLIHNRTIGYHFCDYSEKSKRNGTSFIRNLVDQIAAHMPEYSKYVEQNEQVRQQLNEKCNKDPTLCFATAVLDPLQSFKPSDGFRYILIDALDECFESDMKTSDIVEILISKILRFPSWLKVILTSRNLTTVTGKIPHVVKRIALNSYDPYNMEDIRTYVSRFLSKSKNSRVYMYNRLLQAFAIRSRSDEVYSSIDEVAAKSEGNFLFVKLLLQYVEASPCEQNRQSLPTKLGDFYNMFFERQFGVDGFDRFRSLFEVLLAVCSPLKLEDYVEILREETGDVTKLIQQVSSLLRFGQDGTVRIYHQSFAEWLKMQTLKLGINKARGHQFIAQFRLQRILHRNTAVTFDELTEISLQVASAGSLEKYEHAIDRLNVTKVRDPQNNQCILHHLATLPRVYLPALTFYLRKFKNVDILDAEQKTPAFYAAEEGNEEHLKLFIDKGADVTSFQGGFEALSPVSVIAQNSGIENFSLIHASAYKGRAKVVELLVKTGMWYVESSKNYPNPIHMVATNGHLETLKVLHSNGVKFDTIALHHAAARNHFAVVMFLLSTVGLRDTCSPCKVSNQSDFTQNFTVVQAHEFFCETALHAAVSRGDVSMVKLILKFGKHSLECRHYSGKTVLMDAVERNDTEMVDLLLAYGANVETQCGNKVTKNINRKVCATFSGHKEHFLYTLYCFKDTCSCGNSAIHLAARHDLWNMAEKLRSTKRTHDLINSVNCAGMSPLLIAIMFDRAYFFENINPTMFKLKGYPIKVFRVVIEFCSTEILEVFRRNSKDISEAIVTNAKDLVFKIVKWSPCLQCDLSTDDDNCIKALEDLHNLTLAEKKSIASKKRLGFLKFILESQKNIKNWLQNKRNRSPFVSTPLHMAAAFGFKNAVEYLVEVGADDGAKDLYGYIPLKYALGQSPEFPLAPYVESGCHFTYDGLFKSCNTTIYDSTLSFLIWSRRLQISKCDAETIVLLKQVIFKRMPLSLYTLFKVGVDINCEHGDTMYSPFSLHLRVGGQDVSEVFKIFDVPLHLKCEQPFYVSELHLLSFSTVVENFGNFLKPSIDNPNFLLQKFINCHPKGVRLLDDCYDFEGFLPIHRAAQNANLPLIKWFESIGVNTQLKTRTGLSALDISILYLGNITHAKTFSWLKDVQVSSANSKYRRQTFDELLKIFFNTDNGKFKCGSSLTGLSPLHTASLKGTDVLKYVHGKVSEIIPGLPINCTNKHWVDPLYLAYFYESVLNGTSRWEFLKTISEQLSDGSWNINFIRETSNTNNESENTDFRKGNEIGEGKMKYGYDKKKLLQYPDREAEYHIIYNHFYKSPDEDHVKKIFQTLPTEPDFNINECRGFYNLLPKFSDVPTERLRLECLQAKYTVAYDQATRRIECLQKKTQYFCDICFRETRFLFEEYANKCYCRNMIENLRSWFTCRLRENRQVVQFIAERMGWKDLSDAGDKLNRWPFFFLYKKVAMRYRSYEYLESLSEAFEMADTRYNSPPIPYVILPPLK